MDGILLAARIILAAVFAVAGVAKLLDAAGSTRALIGFGIPARVAGPLGTLLPVAELAVAVALIPLATAWWAALGALLLLGLFVVGISDNLARGRRPDCHCFGQLHSRPVGAETLTRNAALAVVAAFIVWSGPGNSGASAVGWLDDLTVAERAIVAIGSLLVLLVGVLVWLQVEVLRQQGRQLLRLDTLEARLDGRYVGAGPGLQQGSAALSVNGYVPPPEYGLPVGTPAPDFDLPDLDGERWSVERLTAGGKPVLLLFVNPSCGPCTSLMPDIGRWQRDHAATATVALVSRGTPEENRRKMTGHGVKRVLVQRKSEVDEAFQVPGTPGAVVLAADGTIASPVAAGVGDVQTLVSRTLRLPPPAPANGHAHANGHVHGPEPGLALGSPAPAIDLTDLDGIRVTSADLGGKRTLLLFWSPGCGFCQRMVPDLKVWEDDPPPHAPALVLVATGPVEQNRAHGLRSPILLDASGATARAYGANGTPIGVLVDAEWRIASTLVGGGPGVLALAGVRPGQSVPA